MDGANFRNRFRYIAYPAIKPILLILTSLSVLWNFRVFTQIYVLQKAGGVTRDTNLLGVYVYRISIGENDYGIGAAIAIVMVVITVLLTLTYLRAMMRVEERELTNVDQSSGHRDLAAQPARRDQRRRRRGRADRPVPRVLDGADVVPAGPGAAHIDAVVPADERDARQLPAGLRARVLLDGDEEQRARSR